MPGVTINADGNEKLREWDAGERVISRLDISLVSHFQAHNTFVAAFIEHWADKGCDKGCDEGASLLPSHGDG